MLNGKSRSASMVAAVFVDGKSQLLSWLYCSSLTEVISGRIFRKRATSIVNVTELIRWRKKLLQTFLVWASLCILLTSSSPASPIKKVLESVCSGTLQIGVKTFPRHVHELCEECEDHFLGYAVRKVLWCSFLKFFRVTLFYTPYVAVSRFGLPDILTDPFSSMFSSRLISFL